MRKLVTHEDPFHIHKSMGIYCLSNLFQLSYYLFVSRNEIVCFCYDSTYFYYMSHLLFFKVLRKRPVTHDNKIISKMSMFIWEELRIHSFLLD